MKTIRFSLIAWAFVTMLPALFAQTNIRPEPGGARLLFVDGNDIRPAPGGPRQLFIDGNNIRPEPGGKRLLFVDGNDVRPEPGGPRLAFWDGPTLRRAPGGPILLVVDGDSIRPQAGGKRLFFIDGPALARPQLTAVLRLLKPEIFASGPAAEKPAPVEPTTAPADGDAFIGEFKIASYTSSDGGKRAGTVTIRKQGPLYALSFQTADSPPWQGIAISPPIAPPVGTGERELWAAIGPQGMVSLGLYQARGGTLTGVWYPLNAAADRSVYGSETLVGAADLGGAYRITAGRLPSGGATYTGTLNIEPVGKPIQGDNRTCLFKWTTGNVGVAFRAGDFVAVCAGSGADCQIVRFRATKSGLAGEFLGKAKADGTYTLRK